MSQNIYVDRTLQFNKGGGGTPKIIMDADDSANILYILPATDATEYVAFGNATKNLDVKFFGNTSGAYMLWDESADTLLLTGTSYLSLTSTAQVDIGTSGTPLVLTAGTPIIDVYTTCASTSGSTSAQAAVFNTVMTAAGGVGGRTLFNMSVYNVALGGWANALKAQVQCNTSGRATGILSAFCAELVLPGSDVSALSGTYAPLEVELNCAASNTPSWRTAFAYMATGGNSTAITAFRAAGDLFILNGLGTASSATNLFHTTGTVSATHGLRIHIDDVAYDILLKVSTYA